MTKSETMNKAGAAAQGSQVARAKAAAKKGASRKKVAPKSLAPAKAANTKAAGPQKEPATAKKAAAAVATKEVSTPRAESKGSKILELIGRTNGATLAEIMTATGWQAHSVRSFLSTAGKKRGIKIESTKNDDGVRNYTIKN